jgi:hypothetical protein
MANSMPDAEWPTVKHADSGKQIADAFPPSPSLLSASEARFVVALAV